MSEAKKYFYLKVKDTFFDSEEMKIIESQKNGVMYQNLYLKLSLLSLKSDGALMFKDTIPYDETMLSSILRVDIDTVRVGLDMFRRLNLVEVLDNGTMYMADIQSMIGRSSSEGERVKAYRERIKAESNQMQTVYEKRTNVQKCTPELELKLETELKLKLERDSASLVIPYLNEKLGSRFKETKAHMTMIKARFDEGYTLEDFKTVIDKRVAKWGKDPKMAEYLRPSTLFSLKHFDEYLNDKAPAYAGGSQLKVHQRTASLDMAE